MSRDEHLKFSSEYWQFKRISDNVRRRSISDLPLSLEYVFRAIAICMNIREIERHGNRKLFLETGRIMSFIFYFSETIEVGFINVLEGLFHAKTLLERERGQKIKI